MTYPAARLAALSPEEREAILGRLSPEVREALKWCWEYRARPDQLPPSGDWRTWLLLGGRGSGKTRTASEWIRAEVESGRRRYLGAIGPTADTIRKIMVEGRSGVMACCPPWLTPEYEPSLRRIVWPNGATLNLYSAEEPSRLRGPNFDALWCDELAVWPNAAEVWDMAQLALRVPGPQGHAPCAVVTTTPRAIPCLKEIIASKTTVVTRARTFDNSANLEPSTLAYYIEKWAGTTRGRAELDGEMIEDADGALWSRDLIEATRVRSAPEDLRRVVVAVDPSGGSGRGNDECGIVVCGRGGDQHGYVLADLSGRYSPDGWARRAIDAFHRHKADRIIAEANFGAAMVENTLRAVAPQIPFKAVHASRGKAVRAEPVLALYEQGKAHIVGHQPQLEDQMCQWEPAENGPSPDRLDAMVWGLTELMVVEQAKPARMVRLNFMGR